MRQMVFLLELEGLAVSKEDAFWHEGVERSPVAVANEMTRRDGVASS